MMEDDGGGEGGSDVCNDSKGVRGFAELWVSSGALHDESAKGHSTCSLAHLPTRLRLIEQVESELKRILGSDLGEIWLA